MPSGRVTAGTTPQTITTAPRNKKGRITTIQIENRHTAAVQVTIQDVFTPEGGSQTTVIKKTLVPVSSGERLTIDFSNPQIEFLGSLQAVADVTTANCEITVAYEWV
ncbi:MAG: hypothetical protein QXH03_02730 [Candidatus Bathyarchaeia archaeon]